MNNFRKILNQKETENSQVINIPLGPSIGQCCGGYAQVKITKYDNCLLYTSDAADE